MLGPQDVGHRVVVRRIVGIAGGRTLYSDTLGDLVDLTETQLTVATSRGPLSVPLAEVHRAKRVPAARRPTGAEIAALELAANEAWPAPVQHRLGDWLLRAAGGWTTRGNSALPIGAPDRPLDEAVDAVQAWYAAQGQPALFNVPRPLAARVDAVLDERGWASGPLVLVQTARLAPMLDRAPAPGDLPSVTLTPAPSDAWLALAAGRKGALPPAARHLLTAVDQVRFAHVYADAGGGPGRRGGDVVAVARGTVTGGGRWLGVTLVEVIPDARRRGLAQHVVRALGRWASSVGATDAFLQVEQRNDGAVALYERLGFTTHHTYRTRIEPG